MQTQLQLERKKNEFKIQICSIEIITRQPQSILPPIQIHVCLYVVCMYVCMYKCKVCAWKKDLPLDKATA